jgi:hypothetical protein
MIIIITLNEYMRCLVFIIVSYCIDVIMASIRTDTENNFLDKCETLQIVYNTIFVIWFTRSILTDKKLKREIINLIQ